MASSGGSVYDTTHYCAVNMQPATPTSPSPSTWWKRFQCCVFSPMDDMELIEATKEGRYEDCERILEKGTSNIDTLDQETKQTALHSAARHGKLQYVELLLKYNANYNAQDSSGNTPLHLSLRDGHKNCSKKILKCDNLQINLANDAQETPLHLAAKKGYIDIVDKLLKMRPDYNAVDSSGNTILHLAAAGDYLDCCEQILKHNAGKINARNNDENTPLHLAAKKGNSNIIACLQQYQADCNLQNSLGDTPLHLAVNDGHFDGFTKIIADRNLNIKLTNNNHLTPLHCAAKTGNAEIIAQLLHRGASCNAKDISGDTPLHLAVTKGFLNCCEKLLAHSDLKINEENKANETPLHKAAEVGRKNVCELILKYSGVNINIVKNKGHQTPLHLAAQQNNHEVIKLLLEEGANWKLRDKYSYLALHYAAETGSVKSCEYLTKAFEEATHEQIKKYSTKASEKARHKKKKDKDSLGFILALKDKRTPLMLAAKNGHYRCCEVLPIDFKINYKGDYGDTDINYQDAYENTALFYATEGDFLKTISYLLEKNANPSILNHEERSVLHQAAKNRADTCLFHLLQNPNTKDLLHVKDKKHHYTPLHEAINNEALACAQMLLNEATITDTCKGGMTPLHLAAKQGDPGICSLLLSSEICLNKENDRQQTPLHVAAMHGSRDACKILMRKGIHALATDKDGRTALHLAAYRGHDRVVTFLIKRGISPHVKDDKGSTPLHLAAIKGHLRSCQILVAKAKRLIIDVDKENKLSVDRAFENKHDEVFAFLIKNLEPNKEIVMHQSPKHKNTLENEERQNQFHKYMHQSLKSENHEKPRVVAAEAILESEWWTAGFFPGTDTNSGDKNQYCTNFHVLIKSHPNLALKAQSLFHECPSAKSGQTLDFRLFENHSCPEARQKYSSRPQSITDGQRIMQEHPVSVMVQNTRADLLHHPLTKAWLMHLWRTFIFYIFTFLLLIEVLFLTSLNVFMGNVHNWSQIQLKCNTTQEQLCSLSSLPEKVYMASNGSKATDDRDDTFSTCHQLDSLWQILMWFFLFIMTGFILFLEGIYLYRLRTDYFHMKRLLRNIQIIFTILSLLPMGICGFQHQIIYTWQWQCGIISLLMEWILFIEKLNQLPVFFVFMPVTRNFIWSFIKALGYILLLLFAFSYIFHLLLADQATFGSVSEAMMKMIVWLLGDLNYDDTFVEGHLSYPHMAKFMFVAFIIIMGGFLANLAIAQPSDRLDEFRKCAVFFQKAAQTTLFLEIKACFPWTQRQIMYYVHRNESTMNNLIEKMAIKIFEPNIIDEKSTSQDTTQQNLEEQVATLVDLCTEQKKALKDLSKQLNILLKRMPDLLKPSS